LEKVEEQERVAGNASEMPAISIAMMWVHWTAKRCAKNIKIAQGWGKK